MKKHRSIIAAMLMAFGATAPGQNASPPASSAAEQQNEMKKWLADLDAQWRATFKRDVSDPFSAELGNLKTQYLTSIQAGITKVSGAGDLDGAIALRNEQKRFSDANEVPAQDDAAVPYSVRQLRAGWRAQIARMENDRAARTKALQSKYDQVLAQAQIALAQHQRLDDALLVKARRDEIAMGWPTPPPAAAAQNPSPATTPKPPATEVAKPAAPVTNVPFGTKPGPALAKVEAQDTVLKPLAKGELVWGNRPSLIFTDIPASFQGFQFTQATKGSDTLRFKVQTDGLVHLACTSLFRNSGNNGNGWHQRSVTAAQLKEKGWQRDPDVELRDSEGNHVFWVFSRICQAGEEFAICTDKYRSPILLLK